MFFSLSCSLASIVLITFFRSLDFLRIDRFDLASRTHSFSLIELQSNYFTRLTLFYISVQNLKDQMMTTNMWVEQVTINSIHPFFPSLFISHNRTQHFVSVRCIWMLLLSNAICIQIWFDSFKPNRHQRWHDYRLTWDPDEYGGVRHMLVLSDQIWRPDIVLYNKQVHLSSSTSAEFDLFFLLRLFSFFSFCNRTFLRRPDSSTRVKIKCCR